MQIVIRIKDKDAQLIYEQLGIDMRDAARTFVKKATEGLVQLASAKKAGAPIDLGDFFKKVAKKDETA